MYKTGLLLTILIFGILRSSQAQKQENVWITGERGGIKIDFNSGSPNIATRALSFNSYEAAASICDPATGQLLFYTDGDTVFNKNGKIMPNGKGLTAVPAYEKTAPTSSSPQGAVIVPMPGGPGKYYIFSLTDFNTYLMAKILFPGSPDYVDYSGLLFYSVVDMTLDGGLGDVVAGQKGIVLDTTTRFTEHMIAVEGDNCNAWVVLLDPQRETTSITRFKAFEVNRFGVQKDPVVSNVFTTSQGLAPYNSIAGFAQSVGQLAISPNRKKLAFTIGSELTRQRLVVFDFNPAIGEASKPEIIDTAVTTNTTSKYYGVCFSPDNSKLYVNDWGLNAIFQYDLSRPSTNDIIASRTQISTSTIYFSNIKRGPDGKIYYFSADAWMGTIDAPNQAGMSCQPKPQVINLDTMANWAKTLPTDVPLVKMPEPTQYHSREGIICAKADHALLTVPLEEATHYVWDNQDTSFNRTITKEGVYWVKYYEGNCLDHIDTFYVSLFSLEPTITIDNQELGTAKPYSTYQWMVDGELIAGATNSTYTVTQNGKYQVIVSDQTTGCVDTAAEYPVTNYTDIPSVNRSIAGQVNIYPNPATDRITIQSSVKVAVTLTDISGKSIVTRKDASDISIRDLAEGIYLLHIFDINGTLIKTEKIAKIK